MSKIEVINTPYVYEGVFINSEGKEITYSQLRVDVQVGDKIIHCVYKLKDIEAEYMKSLLNSEFVD